ncbi:GGDEF domain-containing protein [Planosporangium mesophilum]|uniref:GGDEF domain-containing protein n=2 Tax=Planosporangium mesophilum TaxID=689768 RepID=A0A8J3WZB5_9ACTN|nr:bifunctional diguanylate cyclase/phosphodiesterase [Planosporangium mesophilum]GII21019.1 GGDEF domain-containing protein [Planosporangium mesophilum]
MAGTSYVSMSRRELHSYLSGLASRLLSAATAETFEPSVGYEVGAALVDAHFTLPTSLDRTLCVLAEQLSGAGTPARASALQSALAAGYAQALRDRTLAEQEEIRAAAMLARSEAEAARWSSEARFQAVFAGAVIGIAIADIDGSIIDVNQTTCDMLGYTPAELRQLAVERFIHPDDAPGVRDAYQDLLRGEREHFRLEKPYYRKDGQAVWTDLVVSLIRDQEGQPQYVVAMIEDITERHHLQIRLRHQALHDPLTQLPNRTLFFERLGQVLDDAEEDARVGVCYLDVDGFKMINDTLGHDMGDYLLLGVARQLHSKVSGPGQLVARTGGDEFVVLVERSAGPEQLVAIAEAALTAIREPVQLGGHEITVSASVGVVERAADTTSATELMKAADTTLHWAKRDGKNRWALFDADRHAHEVAKFELSASLPAALERGEFLVEYQPLVRLLDETVMGVEALVRWRHPKLGLLGPDRFIEMSEETGLIVPLGQWVLGEACRQAAAWQRQYPEIDLVTSVNLAVRQVQDPGIVDVVSAILSETGLDPAKLQLELTESAVMGTAGRPLQTLNALAGLGVRLAIDDFGTGYSNLAYLRSLPVHSLKLAGSFVAGLRPPDSPDPVDKEIVATLIKLAHTLHLTVTAEGVETPQQAARLRALGCDTAQGWHYAMPGAAEEVIALLNPRSTSDAPTLDAPTLDATTVDVTSGSAAPKSAPATNGRRPGAAPDGVAVPTSTVGTASS